MLLFKVKFSTREGTVYATSNTKDQLSTTNCDNCHFQEMWFCRDLLVGIPDLSSKGAFSFISPNIFPILYLCEATKN